MMSYSAKLMRTYHNSIHINIVYPYNYDLSYISIAAVQLAATLPCSPKPTHAL